MRFEISELCEKHKWSDAASSVLKAPPVPGRSKRQDLLAIGKDIIDPRHKLGGSERDSLLVPIIATLLRFGDIENVRELLFALSSDALRNSLSNEISNHFWERMAKAEQSFVGNGIGNK